MANPALPSHDATVIKTGSQNAGGEMLIEQAGTSTSANIHRRALGPSVDHLPRQFWSLLDYCGLHGRICPAPEAWNRLWEMLCARSPDRRPPMPPASTEPGNSRKWALVDHLLWSEQLGTLGEVEQFLRRLNADQWAMED